MQESDSLENRIINLECQVKRYAVIATVVGLLLGGGGVFGVAQWAYKAPLDKQVLKYESAIKSLNSAIQAASDLGAKEESNKLRMALVGLDKNYRTALGLIEECMKVLSRSHANQQDEATRRWLNNTSHKLQQLRTQRKPLSELDNSKNI